MLEFAQLMNRQNHFQSMPRINEATAAFDGEAARIIT
jgi:hypothetical protein